MDMIRVERNSFDPDEGTFQYYVYFKPSLNLDEGEVHSRVPVEAALSVSETGELADLSFTLPKTCRSEQALSFIKKQEGAKAVNSRVFVAMKNKSGDAVLQAQGQLELDLAGRIVGMAIQWTPIANA